MDKETLSNYGWIVICVLVLAVMIALATPFGSFIAGAVENTTEGLFGASQKAMNQTGLLNIADQEMEHGATVNGGGETTPDTNTPSVPKNGYIPEGAYYLTGVTAATNDNTYYTIGKELVAGDAFPDEVKAYDMYVDENGLWSGGFHFGDWLALDGHEKDDRYGGTDLTYIASAYLRYYSRPG